MRGSLRGAVAAMALAWGCASGAGGEGGEGAPAAELLVSVQATPGEDAVHFVLQVTNTAEEPVELAFTSGQSFDFAVSDAGGEVWRWSAARSFMQALRNERLAGGGTLTYEAEWVPPPGASGEYVVTGTLTARDGPVQQSARFRLP